MPDIYYALEKFARGDQKCARNAPLSFSVTLIYTGILGWVQWYKFLN